MKITFTDALGRSFDAEGEVTFDRGALDVVPERGENVLADFTSSWTAPLSESVIEAHGWKFGEPMEQRVIWNDIEAARFVLDATTLGDNSVTIRGHVTWHHESLSPEQAAWLVEEALRMAMGGEGE